MEPYDPFDVLRKFAELYLQRPLTQEEISTLRNFYASLRPTQKQHAHSEKLLQAIKEASDRAGQHLASNMGVMQDYSLNTAVGAGAAEKAGQIGVADNLTSLLTVLNTFKSKKSPGL
jgi:hypothetical protein